MKPIYGLLAITIFLTACTTMSKGEPTKREQWKVLEQKPGAITGTVKARNGDSTDFLIVLETDFNTVMTTSRSEPASACENSARMRPAQLHWIEACDLALAEPNLGAENRRVTQFNKALILRNLDKRSEAKNMLSHLSEENPEFSEADYALAVLEYDGKNYNAAVNHAQKAIDKGLKSAGRAYYIIGKSHEFEFEFQAARRAFETGLEHNKGASNLRLSLERLNRLWPEKIQ